MKFKISIAKDFSKTPGARNRTDGPYSGEEFREDFLEPALLKYDVVTVVLDGAYGYPLSFLEEVFGGLVRKFGAEKFRDKLKIISKDEPHLIYVFKSLMGIE